MLVLLAASAAAPQHAFLGSGGQLARFTAEPQAPYEKDSSDDSYHVIMSLEPWFPNMFLNGQGLPRHDLLLITGGSNLYQDAAYLPFVANPYLEDALPVLAHLAEQERNIDVLYRSSHCAREKSREALASTVRVALERRNLTFRAIGLCKAGGHGAEIRGDGKGLDAWDQGCPECARSKVVLALESCLEGADYLSEKIYLATSNGAILAYRGNGQGLLDSMGFNRDAMIDRATFASDEDFAEYIAKLVADSTAVKQRMATKRWKSDSGYQDMSKAKENVRTLTCKQLHTPGTRLHILMKRAKDGGRPLRIYGAGKGESPTKTHSPEIRAVEVRRLWEELLCLPEDSLVLTQYSQGADIQIIQTTTITKGHGADAWAGTTPPKVGSTCATTSHKLGDGQGAMASFDAKAPWPRA